MSQTPDRWTADLLEPIPTLRHITDDGLTRLADQAAREFTSYTLHAQRPVDRQGDRDERAWALRRQRAEAAGRLWLAVQTEQERRR